MTNRVDQSNQILRPSPIPIVNPAVQATLDGEKLSLEFKGEQFQCDSNQALVWALCSPGINTLHQAAYQLETLDQYDHPTDALSYLCETVALFEQRRFLSLAENEQIEYPIDLSTYSHFMSSRGGVYAFNQQEVKRLAHGMFYGLAIDELGNLLAVDYPHLASPEWSMTFTKATGLSNKFNAIIRQFNISEALLGSVATLHEGIGNNCHQMVNHEGYLYIVDTANQQITEISPSGKFSSIFPKRSAAGFHLNSLTKTNNGWLLMQSSSSIRDLRSHALVLDENWSRVQEIPLSTLRAHDLVVSTPVANTNKFHEEGFWYCRSSNNEIGHHPSGTTVRLEKPHFTRNNKVRGLSESEQHLLVGHGRVRKHKHPTHFPHRGSIAYIDKASLRQTHQIEVPELPCCLIKNPWYRAPSRV